MSRIKEIAGQSRVQSAMASFRQDIAQVADLIIAIQQIPSPTFAEAKRADFVQERFAALGLEDVGQDALHNVYGRYPGMAGAPPVIISAHLDTVFPAGTDLAVRRNGQRISGPGIADNSTGVAGLLILAKSLRTFKVRPAADLWFVANVGEEGLGDLCGMRAVVKRFGSEAVYLVVEGGSYGQISHQAIGVRRFRIEVTTPGGHSWAQFGRPSAIHILGRLIAAIDRLAVTQSPKTTYNVGVIEGGTSINTIAQSARMLLDLRSEDKGKLDQIVGQVTKLVKRAGGPDVATSMTPIGERPSGRISRDTPLVKWAEAALRQAGCRHVEFMNGSTDANIPLSQGLASVCIGLADSGNVHRHDEYVDLTNLPDGLSQLLLLALAAARL